MHRLHIPSCQYLTEKKPSNQQPMNISRDWAAIIINTLGFLSCPWVSAGCCNKCSCKCAPSLVGFWISSLLADVSNPAGYFFRPFSKGSFSLRKAILDSESQVFCSFIWADVSRLYENRYLGGSLCQLVLIVADTDRSGSAHPYA